MLSEYLQARYKLSFYRAGDVYSEDSDGNPLTRAEQDKWFAAADAGSQFVAAVQALPPGDNLEHIQALAVERLGLELDGPCAACGTKQRGEVLGSNGLCGECAEGLKHETLAAMYETATDGWHD